MRPWGGLFLVREELHSLALFGTVFLTPLFGVSALVFPFSFPGVITRNGELPIFFRDHFFSADFAYDSPSLLFYFLSGVFLLLIVRAGAQSKLHVTMVVTI